MKLTFWGAAGTVTGSMHELRINGKRILLDCGLYQGRRKAHERSCLPASSLDPVLLSLLSMRGNLPTLAKHGFAGHLRRPPADLQFDAARFGAFAGEGRAYLAKRHRRRSCSTPPGRRRPPLYSTADAERVLPLSIGPHYQDTEVAPGATYRTYDASHILGSAAMVSKE
jgi:metallo-beta-lactamase family protein